MNTIPEANQVLRATLAEQMAAYEREHGPVVCEPIRTEWAEPLMVDTAILEAARKRGGLAGSRHRQIKKVQQQEGV